MFRPLESVEDYKILTQDLKRQNSSLKSENRLLKVKVRKQQDDLHKKEKSLQQNLLDPSKAANVRKLLSENGAAIVMLLKTQNEQLGRSIYEKEAHIKRLQNSLNSLKAYQNASPFDKTRCNESRKAPSLDIRKSEEQPKMNLGTPENPSMAEKIDTMVGNSNSFENTVSVFMMSGDHQNKNVGTSNNENKNIDCNYEYSENSSDEDGLEEFDDAVLEWAQSILTQNLEQIKCQYVDNDVKARYESLTKDHLVSIIENLKLNIRNVTNYCGKLSSRIQDIERGKLRRTKTMQYSNDNAKINLNAELEQMKATIAQLQEDKHTKDTNIKQLADEIERLKAINTNNLFPSAEDMKACKISSSTFRYVAELYVPENDNRRSKCDEFIASQSRKRNNKAQISRALKLLRDQKKHPEKYGRLLTNLEPSAHDDEHDDDNDVFTSTI